jgi:uncharacterized membrane protein HdeD (DUF308 family)
MNDWPPVRWWFIVLRAFLVAAGIVLMAQLDTAGLLALGTWLKAGIGGIVAAANAGHSAWPEATTAQKREQSS